MPIGLVGLPFLGGAQGYTQLADGSYAMNLAGLTDPDATAWAAAVTANGGTYTAPQLSALSTFFGSMRAAGLWPSKFACFGPLWGNDLAAAVIQYTGGSWGPATNVNFVGGDYAAATGLTGNGTKYLRTGLIPSASLTLNDTHIAIYNRAASAAGGGVTIGTRDAGNTVHFELFAPFNDGAVYAQQYDPAGGRLVTGVIALPASFLVASRTAAASHVVYRNAVSLANNATSGGSLLNTECWVFGSNGAGTPVVPTSHPLAAYSIGSGLTAGNVATYNTAMQALQTALGRNV